MHCLLHVIGWHSAPAKSRETPLDYNYRLYILILLVRLLLLTAGAHAIGGDSKLMLNGSNRNQGGFGPPPNSKKEPMLWRAMQQQSKCSNFQYQRS